MMTKVLYTSKSLIKMGIIPPLRKVPARRARAFLGLPASLDSAAFLYVGQEHLVLNKDAIQIPTKRRTSGSRRLGINKGKKIPGEEITSPFLLHEEDEQRNDYRSMYANACALSVILSKMISAASSASFREVTEPL